MFCVSVGVVSVSVTLLHCVDMIRRVVAQQVTSSGGRLLDELALYNLYMFDLLMQIFERKIVETACRDGLAGARVRLSNIVRGPGSNRNSSRWEKRCHDTFSIIARDPPGGFWPRFCQSDAITI